MNYEKLRKRFSQLKSNEAYGVNKDYTNTVNKLIKSSTNGDEESLRGILEQLKNKVGYIPKETRIHTGREKLRGKDIYGNLDTSESKWKESNRRKLR